MKHPFERRIGRIATICAIAAIRPMAGKAVEQPGKRGYKPRRPAG
jgi:hypothetical protein